MPSKIFSISDFRGGLNVDKTSENLSDNELEKAENVDYTERGGAKKRKDIEKYSTSFGQQVERIIEWSKSDGEEEILALLADKNLTRNSNHESIFQLYGTHINYFILKEYLYLVDGNNYYRIDDDTFNYEAVPESDESSTEDDGESFTAELAVATDLKQDNLVSGSETVTLYSDTGTTFIKDTDYTMNYSTGSIVPLSTGDMEDDERYYIDYKYTVPSDNDLTGVRKCQYIVRHPKSMRIFAAGNPNNPSAIYYSESLEPGYFKSTSILYPTTNDGAIQGLKVFNDMLLVFYQNTIWAWRGISPEYDAVWEKLPIKHGTYNFRTLDVANGVLTFLDNSGIYAVDINKGISNLTDGKVTNIINSISNKTSVHTIYDPSNNRLLLAYSDTDSRCDEVLTYDWEIGAFAKWTGLGDVNDFCYTLDGELLMASENYIMKMNSDTRTNDITFEVKLKEMKLKFPYQDKLIKNLFLTLDNYTEDTLATIYIDNTTKPFSITSNISRNHLHEKGVNIQISVKDDSKQGIALYNAGIEYKPVFTYRKGL